ncbi:M56 family metallopeptidase [Undibacterium sp. CY18W]|uniref:M56 family metallopeptidase n=1 Tax=Undibacterium hunanense TaxID=2762292 RepID=A0ABR6ZKZ0_9BURK|nr:M56 family metallopeptidase [Undibacterium hunanense]MBC3916095.1 M56 family metallopeptidase [Undibacterium hunanense]
MSQFLPSLINALGWALLHFVWQGLLIALFLALLLKCIGPAQTRARYIASYMALLTCMVLPARELCLRLDISYSSTEAGAMSDLPIRLGLNQSSWMNVSAWLEMHLSDIVMVWLLCVALLAMRMGVGLLWIGTYASPRRSKPDLWWQARIDQLSRQFQIQGKVVLRVVDDLSTPLAVGIFRPMILLPGAMLTGMPVDLLEMLVAHEMAHIKRHDYLLNLVQATIEMLLFYHPAVWWISRQIRHDREEIADDLAARVTGEPRRLALALSELANFQFTTPQLAQAAHGGNLMSRIKRLVKPEVSTVNWKAALAILGITTSCLAVYAQANVPVAAVAPVAIVTSAEISQQAMDAAKLANERDGDKKPVINFKDCKPEYPRASIRREETGVVQTSVLVASDGQILKAKVDRSTGFPDLDNAVTSALENCAVKAIPGQVKGENTTLWVKVQYVWKLK